MADSALSRSPVLAVLRVIAACSPALGAIADVLGGAAADRGATGRRYVSPSIQAKRLKALAMTSPRRHPQYPDVATVSEQGVPGFDAEAWWGLLAPANTPAPILSRMHGEFAKALKVPAVQQHLEQQALTLGLSSPEEFGKFVAAEVERWARVVRDNKIKAGD